MFDEIDLKALAAKEGPERAFVSLYVSGKEGTGFVERRERRILSLLEEEEDERTHFVESMALLRRFLEENPPDAPSDCAFASWAADFATGCPLPVAGPDLLRLDASPYIRPLAELRDEYEPFVVVAADATRARIFLVTDALAVPWDRVRGDVKNRVKKGGWSQQRYARRRENELHHYAKEVEEVLAEASRESDFDRIVLLGSDETLREIEEALPKALADKVVAREAVDLKTSEGALLAEAFDLFFEEEREEEERVWDLVRNEWLRGGLAAMGPEETLFAVQNGRADTVLVNRDAKIPGIACRDCENVRPGGDDETCAVCGTDDVFPVDLVEEIVRETERTSARVEFADPVPALAKEGGVAALLRW